MAAAIAVVVCFVLVAFATTLEGAFVVLFGWVPFLWRSLREVKPDGPSVLVGGLALLLFAGGVHWLGLSWRGNANPATRWRTRWTAAAVLGVVLLFTAGISVIGITHQVAWLATSEQPLVGEGIRRNDTGYNTRMIGLGLHGYHDANDTLPPGGTSASDGELLHSWETHILPYLTYSASGIDMKRRWNDPVNEKYFQCVLPVFINPAYRTPPLEDANGFGLSHYAANSRVMSLNTALKLTEIQKGTSNVILVGEVNTAFRPWGHPVNWRDPAAGLDRGANTFGGPTRSGTTFIMADGSIRFVGNGADPAVLRALADPRE
jgi:hypothetical protein